MQFVLCKTLVFVLPIKNAKTLGTQSQLGKKFEYSRFNWSKNRTQICQKKIKGVKYEFQFSYRVNCSRQNIHNISHLSCKATIIICLNLCTFVYFYPLYSVAYFQILRFKRTLWAHYIRYSKSNYIFVKLKMPQNDCQNLNDVSWKIKPQSKIKQTLSFSEMHVKRPHFSKFLVVSRFKYLWYFCMDFDEILNEHSRISEK